MKKTFYLMRHGQTLFNLRRKIQGACDSPLTELGIKQARTAGEYFNVFDNNTVEMIVPYGKGQDVISELNSEKAMYNFVYAKEVIKQATGYTVTCYQYQIEKLIKLILKKDY